MRVIGECVYVCVCFGVCMCDYVLVCVCVSESVYLCVHVCIGGCFIEIERCVVRFTKSFFVVSFENKPLSTKSKKS